MATDGIKTHVILDGLQDPLLARELSACWTKAGFDNAVDVAGQCAWLRPTTGAVLDESAIATAASIARAFGVEPRDRAASTFRADNDLPALREQITREYRARFSQSLVFGLPALVVHYLGPMLASGGGASASSMAYPWLLEAALVGWSLWVAALPILWQGAASVLHLRATPDLLTSIIVAAAYLPSLLGVASLLFTDTPWFGMPDPEQIAPTGPAFHIAVTAVMLATFQRWQLHKHSARLAGRGQYMLPRVGRLIAGWALVMAAVAVMLGWHAALSFGVLLPPMISSGGINRWSPGWSAALPVIAFAPLVVFAESVKFAPHAAAMRFEIAVGFAWMMATVMALGWSRMPVRE